MKSVVFVICSLVGVAGASQLAHSGTNTAAIHGVVTDPSGAVIAGAMVTISTPHWTQTVSTNESGEYLLTGLDASVDHHCRVTVHYGGFAPFEKSTFVLAAGRETEADAQLEVHEVRQTVTVYE
jgi:Carboxypeptidase regulatory-like domain